MVPKWKENGTEMESKWNRKRTEMEPKWNRTSTKMRKMQIIPLKPFRFLYNKIKHNNQF